MACSELVKVQEVNAFVQRCMSRIGTNEGHAKQLAELLVTADSRGHLSHGLNRLEMYIRDVKSGTTLPDGQPSIEKETVSTALVNGNNILGPVVSNFCMDLAMKKAKDTGIGWVSCHGSNHFGIAGFYSMAAAKQGLIGMAMTNTSPLMVPTRAKTKTLGTNALSVAATGQNSDTDMFVLDMATTAAAVGKIEMCKRKNENIPNGWAVDETGQPTTDGHKAMEGGLMPLGGSESTSGYKGFGLGFMVELFCGILSGSKFGPHVRNWNVNSVEADLGHCFVALDPSVFAPGFEGRLSSLMNHCRGLDPAVGETEVLVAGDPERKHISQVEKEGGIYYHRNLLTSLDTVADDLQVERLKRTKDVKE